MSFASSSTIGPQDSQATHTISDTRFQSYPADKRIIRPTLGQSFDYGSKDRYPCSGDQGFTANRQETDTIKEIRRACADLKKLLEAISLMGLLNKRAILQLIL